MALLDLIKHRKSIRDFIDRPVERKKIMLCLEAARLAPPHLILNRGNLLLLMTQKSKKGCVMPLSVLYTGLILL